MLKGEALNQAMRNLARGNKYHKQRHKILAQILAHPDEHLEPLSSFLAKRIFERKPGQWMNLEFIDHDWRYLERLRANSSLIIDNNYLSLTLDYIKANASDVQYVYFVDLAISNALLSGDETLSEQSLAQLTAEKFQSLFMLRLTCALNHSKGEKLLTSFNDKGYSPWFTHRFLYPFVYYFLNVPQDQLLDLHLSYAMPPGHENPIERAVIKFLLRDEIEYAEPLAFKCYVALLSHPYDACEFLLNHFEMKFAERGRLDAADQTAIEALAEVIPSWRLEKMREIFNGDPVPFTEDASTLPICSSLELDQTCQDFFNRFSSLNEFDFDATKLPASILKELSAIRAPKYPGYINWSAVMSFSHRFSFTTAGRFVHALFTSLFMVKRRERNYEIREILRLVGFLGKANLFILSSPRGLDVLEVGILKLDRAGADVVVAKFDEMSAPGDRGWLKKTHWSLMLLERDTRLAEWMDQVKRHIGVAPNYLTGIDWAWIESVLKITRIAPFRENVAGAYVLLLQLIEEDRRMANALRLSLEPYARRAGTVEKFMEWLIAEYGEDAIAFVRFFLSPDMILWLRLADNYTIALTQRMEAIRAFAVKFRLETPLLTEEIFLQEQRAFTASLLMINVGSNQFCISWDVLLKDIGARQADLFRAFVALSREPNPGLILSEGVSEAPYRFANGVQTSYHLKASEWPLVGYFLGAIDTFMEHPSQGIESILSVRIRHNMMRREFTQAIQRVRRANLRDTSMADRAHFAPMFEDAIYGTLQGWLDSYMHQLRPEKPQAIFNFVPSQEDIDEFISEFSGTTSYDAVISGVLQWVRSALSAQLSIARECISHELVTQLQRAISEKLSALQAEGFAESALPKVAAALGAAIQECADQLLEWFESPSNTASVTASLPEMFSAIENRFATEVGANRIRLVAPHRPPPFIANADQVHLLYHFWCEVVQNALKHKASPTARLRVSGYDDGDYVGLRFSSLSGRGVPWERAIDGHPYKSLSEAIFREGESGLDKIASLAASIVGAQIQVRAVMKGRSFHLLVPLQRSAKVSRSERCSTILIVEDDDAKYEDIVRLVQAASCFSTYEVRRATTTVDAECELEKEVPALLILDISMNISAGSLGPMRGGYANLGGMDIAERLYLDGKAPATIIVTGFDYFRSSSTQRASEYEMVSLEDIRLRAEGYFGKNLLGCIRYGADSWTDDFNRAVKGAVQ